MSYPKLSALLNNCILHAITPELTQEIIKISLSQPTENGHFMESYEQLKAAFQKYYGINTLNWQDFAATLESYNPLDQQIILGPVLRMFMASNMESADDLPIDIQEIQQSTQLDKNAGRYNSLGPDQLFAFVSKNLGFAIHYHQQASNNPPFPLNQRIALIHIYHEGGIDGAQHGGHWERVPKGTPFTDYAQNDNTQLKEIIGLINEPKTLDAGLALMQWHVRATLNAVKENTSKATLEHTFTDINLSAFQIKNYFKRVLCLKKNTAMASLGQLTPFADDFIRDNEQDDQDKEFEPYYHDSSAAGNLSEENKLLLSEFHKPVNNLAHSRLPNLIYQHRVTLQQRLPENDLIKPKLPPKQTYQHSITRQQRLFDSECSLLLDKIADYKIRRDKVRNKEKLDQAINAAQTLYQSLMNSSDSYFKDPTIQNYAIFQRNCLEYINTAHQTLDDQRGWLGVIDKIIIAIGVAMGVIKLSNTPHSFFATDSRKKLDAITEVVNQVSPAA